LEEFGVAREIFRKAALERMASPERLDRPVRLVGTSGWLVLLCFCALIAAGVVWAAVTMAPIKVRGQGILIDEAGLVELVSEQGGLLQSIDIAPGDLVEPGQVLATLSRTDLRRDLAGAEARLEDQRRRFDRLLAAQEDRIERESAADTYRLSALNTTLSTLRARLPILQERAEELAPLVERGVVQRSRLLEAQISVSDLEERISNLIEDIQGVELQASERSAQRDLDLLEERLAIDEQIREIERLEAQLAEERVIRSTHAGRVVEMQVNSGDVLPAGGALATLTQVGDERQLVALMFVPSEEGKRIAPGMTAEISPTTVEREVFGYIRGEVISVSELPATPEGMGRLLQNDQLVQQLSLAGPPIEVRVRLTSDTGTETGYAWSASDGPVSGVNAGTLLAGDIIIEERPIIDLVAPGASQRLASLLDSAVP
jgi:HlyD family secretion protein